VTPVVLISAAISHKRGGKDEFVINVKWNIFVVICDTVKTIGKVRVNSQSSELRRVTAKNYRLLVDTFICLKIAKG
jgi:hypothetical protein